MTTPSGSGARSRRPALSLPQRRALDTFRKMDEESGGPPSIRNLADELKINISAAHRLVVRLAKAGHLVHQDGPGSAYVLPENVKGKKS